MQILFTFTVVYSLLTVNSLQFLVVIQSIHQFMQDQNCGSTFDLKADRCAVRNGLQGCLGVERSHTQQTTGSWDEMGVMHAGEQLGNYPIHMNWMRGVGE